ncbi:unnamed protein product [Urochloa decumbens]|uniref:GDSL esterase/lipase n=1 Tax=Urochloa decumbens TaxID=240449 RepID=A0ABC9ETQ2_9POAL
MGSEEECFDKSGPEHITDIDWGKEEHRRSITACLVKATSLLESDRIKGRQGTPAARAPAWWERLHFRLHRPLLTRRHPPAAAPPPRFVVAFRGTKLRFIPDIKDDLRIVLNRQGACSRFRKAREHVAELLASIGGDGAVWLAGHSLGASVALDVGRDLMMGKKERNLPTFLFNPPYVSLAAFVSSTLRASEAARQDWFSFKCVAKGAAACTVMRSRDKRMEDMFRRLGPWVPELYVHKDGKICQGYIDHFERQEKVLAERTGILRRLANKGVKHSFRDMAQSSSARPNYTQGHTVDDEEEVQQRVQPHLLPSVRLWKSSTEISGFCHTGWKPPFSTGWETSFSAVNEAVEELNHAIKAHKLKHWWKPDEELNLSPKRYLYRRA